MKCIGANSIYLSSDTNLQNTHRDQQTQTSYLKDLLFYVNVVTFSNFSRGYPRLNYSNILEQELQCVVVIKNAKLHMLYVKAVVSTACTMLSHLES